jgi:YVTN family beta-propeller protein
MRISLRGLAVLTALTALAAAATGCVPIARLAGVSREHRVFVSNMKDGTVSVLSSDPGTPTETISVGNGPAGLAARVVPPLVAVAVASAKRVSFIDPIGLQVVRSVDLRDVPEFLAFSSDGTLLFATLPKTNSVAVIEADSGRVRDPIRLKQPPKRLVASPDGRQLFVLQHARPGSVAVVDIDTRKVESTIAIGAFPTDLGLSRDGYRLLTANFDNDNVSVIDTVTRRAIATWHVDTGLGLLVHPTEPLAYSMASFDSKVVVLNYDTGKVVTTLATGEFPIYSAITPDGRFLYVVNRNSNTVAKVDTHSNAVVHRYDVGITPIDAVVVEPPAAR